MKDWVAWHAAYDDPSSALNERLRAVRSHLSAAIDRVRPGPVRLVSLCAGEGRDVMGVLPDHPRRHDVTAVLIESDARNAETARRSAAQAGLAQVEVRLADASTVASYADALPADVLLLCGIFGNISDSDISQTAAAAPSLCAAGATAIWTRHRRPPDLTPQIRAWFADSGFDEVAFDALDNATCSGVGVHQLRRSPPPGLPSHPLFRFRPS
ncbi:MAG TPA: SAM-dependent methyltransferase [Streptosporangiaceae bacterium]|nr:SAM-dependent methyltransferase [Streptosporangiaceae bacterium]